MHRPGNLLQDDELCLAKRGGPTSTVALSRAAQLRANVDVGRRLRHGAHHLRDHNALHREKHGAQAGVPRNDGGRSGKEEDGAQAAGRPLRAGDLLLRGGTHHHLRDQPGAGRAGALPVAIHLARRRFARDGARATGLPHHFFLQPVETVLSLRTAFDEQCGLGAQEQEMPRINTTLAFIFVGTFF